MEGSTYKSWRRSEEQKKVLKVVDAILTGLCTIVVGIVLYGLAIVWLSL